MLLNITHTQKKNKAEEVGFISTFLFPNQRGGEVGRLQGGEEDQETTDSYRFSPGARKQRKASEEV